ncbi:ABC transporter substrate-binding protein [Phyllobacterium sp. SB3]|uniref:ABC transporter substrate-binding protein n=1 Tax=Phyllobacterium sp. SB3 TaxID=3156073 RepID=UPI0032AEB611
MRIVYSLVALAALSLPVAGPVFAQTITASIPADIRSTNPGVNREDTTDAVVMHVIEGLVGYAEDTTVGPLLAEKYEISGDGLTYTFTLRQGIKFHNGADLTSADVLWSWNRYLDPKTEWRCLSDVDGTNGLKIESVAAPDPQTFVMKLNRPSVLFLDTLARTDCAMAGILHKDSVNADGSWNKPIGTGPFKLDEWKRGQSIRLSAFEDYKSPPGDRRDGYLGSKRPLVKQLNFIIVPDSATAKTGLLGGNIDIAQIQESDVAELQASPNLDVKVLQNAVRHGLIIQTRDPLLKNAKLRQAIAAAIDYKELVATVTSGLGTVNNSPIYPGSRYFSAAEKEGFTYDSQKASGLLKEAGYNGEPITIIANKRTTVPSYPVAVIAQAMLQAAGINAQIEVMEWPAQLDRYNSGKYQIESMSYSARFDPALAFEQIAGSKEKQPRKVWDVPQDQVLIDKLAVIGDPVERQPIIDQLHKRMLEEVPVIFTHNENDCVAFSRKLQGVTPWQSKLRLWEISVQN